MSHSHLFLEKKLKQKTSLLGVSLAAIAGANVAAAPEFGNQTATLNPEAAQAYHIQNSKKYGSPKPNPSVIHSGGRLSDVGAFAFDGEYCGNGCKPIPGGSPVESQ